MRLFALVFVMTAATATARAEEPADLGAEAPAKEAPASDAPADETPAAEAPTAEAPAAESKGDAPADKDEAPADEAPADPAEEEVVSGWVGAGGSGSGTPVTQMNAWDALERLPPKQSVDLGVVVSYGDLGWHRGIATYSGAGVGFGIRGAWGTHKGNSRYGVHFGGGFQGPVPIYFSVVGEALPSWDLVKYKLQLGASLGPSFMLNYSDEEGAAPSVAPTLAVRLGYSEGWSRVSRRFFVVLEPKARWVRGRPELLCSVVIGQGRGR